MGSCEHGDEPSGPGTKEFGLKGLRRLKASLKLYC
jgi:hypothetical protein